MRTQEITISIERRLEVEPEQVSLSAGDRVQFQNDAPSTAFLQFETPKLFGKKRYEIDSGATLPLAIKKNTPKATYIYGVKVEGTPRAGSPCIIVNGSN